MELETSRQIEYDSTVNMIGEHVLVFLIQNEWTINP